jgi:ATP-dependent Clp protease adapter protein ClpS
MSASPQTTCAARALLQTASALSNVQAHHAMIPEALLLALLCDPALGDVTTIPEEPELRGAILQSNEERNAIGWSSRAMAAYTRAWKRAGSRERGRPLGERLRSTWRAVSSGNGVVPVVLSITGTLSVGDVAHGLSGSSTLVDEVLRRRAIDPQRFDDEPPSPEVGYPAGLADDAEVDVIAVNDDVTRMEFVVDVLQRHFDHEPLRATYFMYRIDACGRARVATCRKRLAEQRIDAVHADARPQGFPLAFVYGPRVR